MSSIASTTAEDGRSSGEKNTRLEGKVVIVTGGGQGIGKAYALHMMTGQVLVVDAGMIMLG